MVGYSFRVGNKFLQKSRKFGSMNNPISVMRSFNSLFDYWLFRDCPHVYDSPLLHLLFSALLFLSILSFPFAIFVNTLYWPMSMNSSIFKTGARFLLIHASLHRNFILFLFLCSYYTHRTVCAICHTSHCRLPYECQPNIL